MAAEKCAACGMAFATGEELGEHLAKAHGGAGKEDEEKKVQCQSCGRFFNNVRELQEHAGDLHNAGQDFARELPPQDSENSDEEEEEWELVKRLDEEEQARRRTRGPYRKASAA